MNVDPWCRHPVGPTLLRAVGAGADPEGRLHIWLEQSTLSVAGMSWLARDLFRPTRRQWTEVMTEA